MKHSLYLKFMTGYLLFGLIGFAVIALFSTRLTQRYLIRQNAENLYAEAVLMAESYEDEISYQSEISGEIRTQLRIVAKFISSQIWIVDDDGRIILDSNQGRFNQRMITDFDPSDQAGYTIGTYYGLFQEDMLSVWAPINYGYAPVGYIIIHHPMTSVTASANEILGIVYLTAAVIFLLSLIILLIFTITVYRPLKAITYAAKEYAAGNLAHRIVLEPASQDEMGYLANTLNYMSGELSKTEEYQREFIANISHDFRSPLTSIKGFSEAILDGTVPEEMREKYLRRVISETERLNKLTEGMLTLNSLDAKNMLRRSNFDINRVIKEVCAASEAVCLKKNLRFELFFADEIEMVYADYGKIQQVLYNLVDNAIKFSDPDAVIRIATIVRQKKVFISVKDTGCGIPKDSIKKIWERFYKTDTSRGRDRNGTGLGLSIVREIIQAHGETIDVVSTEKIGTEFTFSLPLSEAAAR